MPGIWSARYTFLGRRSGTVTLRQFPRPALAIVRLGSCGFFGYLGRFKMVEAVCLRAAEEKVS
ncbi:MAG: hypothetical protein K6U74_01230 [Firmicutes bacterium]|nr:hypothetical protein [Bacillota bacterium]